MQKGNAKNQRELVTPAPKENNRNRKRNDSEKESKKEGEGEDKEKEKKERKPWSEGSLGKPVSSSGNWAIKMYETLFLLLVHNPRKMIQIMVKSAEESVSEEGGEGQNAIEPPKQTNKLKLLKEIEAAFMVLMDLELMVQVCWVFLACFYSLIFRTSFETLVKKQRKPKN